MNLAIDLIRCDGGTQMRVSSNEEAIESYAEMMENGDEFPAVVVYYDGAAYWLADGFHRVAARRLVASRHVGTDKHHQWTKVDADLRSGTRHDAIKFAIGANKTNGLRRTNADKQLAVRTALAHPDMRDMSDRAIAAAAGVSHVTVIRARQLVQSTSPKQPIETIDAKPHKAVNTESDRIFRTGLDGKRRPVAPSPNKVSKPVASKGDDAKPTPTKQRHVCPHCNGEGYVYE